MGMPMRVSVVVPVYNNSRDLRECLSALLASSAPAAEIIVVDDASTDDTQRVAVEMGVTVVRMPTNSGPGIARNYGARLAQGDILFFVDSDVAVAPDAVARVARIFEERPDVAAAFGSYDDRPRAKGLVSQYRNLLHHFVHQHGKEAASTFWAGCGAVRRSVFEDIGGFDETFRPTCSVDDIELGYRLRRAGHHILLDKALQGKHLKRWTFYSCILTDITLRALPWSRLILETGTAPNDLNLTWGQRASFGLVALACLSLPLALFRSEMLVLSAAALGGVLFLNRDLYGFFFRQRGFLFAAACVPLHFLYYLYSGLAYVYVWTAAQCKGIVGQPVNNTVAEVTRHSTSRMANPLQSEPGRKSAIAVLVSLLAVALALRLYRLDDGLWWDEILMYVDYVKMPLGRLIATYQSENQHFLYILLARASIWAFGDTVWSLRFPAVLFGVGSIWALYLLGRQVSGAREALFAAALLTFSYHHIWFSQNARGYIGLLFWTILTSWCLLRAMREGRASWWVLYGTAAALGVYTHLIMLFVITGQAITYGISLRSRRSSHGWGGFLIGFSIVGLLSLLLYGLVVSQVINYMLVRIESSVAFWKNPLWTFAEFVRAMEMGFAGGFGAFVAFVIFGTGLLSFQRTTPVIVQLLMVPTVICAAVVIGVGHHLWPRYFIFTMGFAALIVVRGAVVTGDVVARGLNLATDTRARLGTALCVGLIVVAAISAPAAYGPKQDYLGALRFVEANRESGDAVVTAGLIFFPYEKLYQRDWPSMRTVEALDAVRGDAKRTWLLYAMPADIEARFPRIMASIRQDFKVVKEFPGTLGGGTIFVCLSDIPPADKAKSTVQESSLFGTY